MVKLSFMHRLCPNHAEAGDLTPLVALVMYAVSVEPIGAMAAGVMLSVSIANTLGDMLQIAPNVEPMPKAENIESSVGSDHFKSEQNASLDQKNDPKDDRPNIFRF